MTIHELLILVTHGITNYMVIIFLIKQWLFVRVKVFPVMAALLFLQVLIAPAVMLLSNYYDWWFCNSRLIWFIFIGANAVLFSVLTAIGPLLAYGQSRREMGAWVISINSFLITVFALIVMVFILFVSSV